MEIVPKEPYTKFRTFATQEFHSTTQELQRWPHPEEKALEVSSEILRLAGRHQGLPTWTQARFKSRYQFIETLASGGFGEVGKYMDRDLGKPVAIKIMLEREKTRAATKVTQDELVASTKLEYILNKIFSMTFPGETGMARCLDVFLLEGEGEGDAKVVMVQELACCGDLDQFIRTAKGPKKHVSIRFLWSVAFQACKTLHLMHAIGLMHNDIKPANMVLDPQTWHLTLVDLGLGCITASRIRGLLDGEGVSDTVAELVCEDRKSLGGTFGYIAPEYLNSKTRVPLTFEPSRDTFALGVSLYQIGTLGGLPYGRHYRDAARAGQTIPYLPSNKLSRAFNRFCSGLCAWDPSQRTTLDRALEICLKNIAYLLSAPESVA